MNSSLAEIINMKLELLLLQKLFRWKKYPKISHLFMTFILHDSSLGRHVNCRVTQKVRNSSLLYYETKNPLEVKIRKKVTL